MKSEIYNPRKTNSKFAPENRPKRPPKGISFREVTLQHLFKYLQIIVVETGVGFAKYVDV